MFVGINVCGTYTCLIGKKFIPSKLCFSLVYVVITDQHNINSTNLWISPYPISHTYILTPFPLPQTVLRLWQLVPVMAENGKGVCSLYTLLRWCKEGVVYDCDSWYQSWLRMAREYGRYIHCYADVKRAWCMIEEFLLAHKIVMNVELTGK